MVANGQFGYEKGQHRDFGKIWYATFNVNEEKERIFDMFNPTLCTLYTCVYILFFANVFDSVKLAQLLAILGDQFDVGDEICGAVVSVRYNEDIISVWNKSADNTEANLKIKYVWVERMGAGLQNRTSNNIVCKNTI